jgi:hypothetical protein
MFDSRLQPAQLHRDMRFGKTPVRTRALQRSARVGKFAKRVNRDARHGPLVRRSPECIFAACRSTFRRRLRHDDFNSAIG